MFPPGQSDDDHFLIHYNNPHQEHSNNQQDLIVLQGQASLEKEKKNIINNMGNDQQHNSDENKEKKMTRKEIERLRREHMAMLHASLRSLLPLESIKGKRSTSEHINEAVNFIEYQKRNIRELSLKRDQLKNLSDFETLGDGSSNSDHSLTNYVTIHPYSGGVFEIVFNSLHRVDNMKLSKILEAVLEEGLDVIRCVSTQTLDDGLFYVIQAEVGDLASVDLCGLQQKLKRWREVFSSPIGRREVFSSPTLGFLLMGTLEALIMILKDNEGLEKSLRNDMKEVSVRFFCWLA